MPKINLIKNKQFYLSKLGEKQYLKGDSGDKTLIEAALLSGKGLESEKVIIHTTYGNTIEEAKNSMSCFLVENPEHVSLEIEELQ